MHPIAPSSHRYVAHGIEVSQASNRMTVQVILLNRLVLCEILEIIVAVNLGFILFDRCFLLCK